MTIFEGFDAWNLLDGTIGAGGAAIVAIWYARHNERAKEKNAKEGMHRIVRADLSLFDKALTGFKEIAINNGNYDISSGTNQWPNMIKMFDAADRFDNVPLELRAQYFEPDQLELIHDIYGRIKGYRSSAQELSRFTKNYELPVYRFKVSDVGELLVKIQEAKMRI
jgi:type I restriction-modification system DNA methylase subunit